MIFNGGFYNSPFFIRTFADENTQNRFFLENGYIYIQKRKINITMPSGIKMTLSDFVKESNIRHNNKYCYDLITEFKGCRTKLPVMCPKHGVFWTIPYIHLQGKGCPKCGNEKIAIKNTYTTEEWVKKAQERHGDKYDYSKTDMEHRREDGKICIICNKKDEFGDEHGEFWMDPKRHLQGQGCPKCGGVYHYTTEEWVKKAQEKHSTELLDFSKTFYKNNNTKVCVICPKHGEFWRNPKTILRSKYGCPFCGTRSIIEEEIASLLASKGIIYLRQVTRKTFRWLENLRLDFYLPDYNIAIECQGEQHYRPIDFAGKGVEWANKSFENNKIRDIRKKNLCKENGVKLFYFAKEKFVNNEEIITSKEELLKLINKSI